MSKPHAAGAIGPKRAATGSMFVVSRASPPKIRFPRSCPNHRETLAQPEVRDQLKYFSRHWDSLVTFNPGRLFVEYFIRCRWP